MHQLPIKEVLEELKATEKGLTNHEAEQRLHQYGLNELKAEEGTSPWKILLQQFISPLVWILVVAMGISFFLGEIIDGIVIAVIIVLNAVLGFVQEYRAEKAIEALRKMASPKAKVFRAGKEQSIDSKYLVPGDIILLETGDKVPADARLIEIHTLETQEAPLTGESQPVTKDLALVKEKTPLADRKNMVYSATVISNGRGKAVVLSTGMKTEVGKIATLIKESDKKLTPLQKKLKQLGKYLTIAVIIVAIIVFMAGILSGKDASVMFLTAIALAVAVIPEGLPAVITISLALGVQRMVKKNALVRKLPSVETLGSVSVICTDKTGTLTHNEMTVTKMWANNTVYDVTGSGYEAKGNFTIKNKLANPEHLHALLTIGAQCNDSHFDKKELFGDPTEAALIVSAEKAGFTQQELVKKQPRTDEIPFSSERKMMTTIHGKVSYTKGAPDIIIELCDRILINGKVQRLPRDIKKEIIKQNESFAKEALRVLGFAYNENVKDAEKNMIFVGLQAMIDPPREEVKNAIQRCQAAGIRVIMITGDQITTAKAIADELGIQGNAITGQELDAHKNLIRDIKEISIFARVNPEHKLKIVEALKKNGHVVAMTGDGVNDAPALKKADIGISMGITGTDVAKEASDMILTDDNFTSIVNAVEEGRGIFENIRKFVNYLLSSNLGEITVILFASLYSSIFGLHLSLPLTAIQILWVNLVTDGLPATALSLDPHSQGIMQQQPRPAYESILSKELQWNIIMFGVLMGIISLILFILYQDSGITKAQTIVFTSLVLFELVRLQTIRAEYKLSILSNKWLVVAIVVSLLLHLATIYTPLNVWFKTTPLTLVDWGILIIASGALYGMYRVINYFMKKKKIKVSSH
ncbi:calcium-translocating P-type ATPase, SERCA-type [Candidatus Woesearchaeota archaeon CG10_big_fil_rev_8_21_14_0_10_36_11]|nr:MAG: calcium-translocating P-type ATPase, SERCA-type [Candidatus Woesearchaeota archaeon CG10_big_fil_rev_8_21_14_0_10_36_11]